MTEAYQGTTGADYDELLDILAAGCAADDPATITTLYAREELPRGTAGPRNPKLL
jgi:hypothetical protein